MVEIKRYRDGMFYEDVVIVHQEDLDNADFWKKVSGPANADKFLNAIESELKHITKEPNINERRLYDAYHGLVRLYLVRNHILRLQSYQDDLLKLEISHQIFIQDAIGCLLREFFYLINNLWKARLRPFEPTFFYKQVLQRGSRKANQQRHEAAESRYATWRLMADEIRAEPGKSRLKNSEVARIIHKRINEKLSNTEIGEKDLEYYYYKDLQALPDTIRKKLS